MSVSEFPETDIDFHVYIKRPYLLNEIRPIICSSSEYTRKETNTNGL